jgi:tetratricopeptide (TPR) repeat protein
MARAAALLNNFHEKSLRTGFRPRKRHSRLERIRGGGAAQLRRAKPAVMCLIVLMSKRFVLVLAFTLAGCAVATRPDGGDSLAAGAFLAGRFAELSRDPSSAATHLQRAARARPDDVEILDAALSQSLAAGDFPAAAALARQARALGADPSYAGLVRAVDALAVGRSSAARGELESFKGPLVERVAARLILPWTAAGGAEPPGPDASVFSRLFTAQQALLLDRAGDVDAAAEAYAAALSGARIPALSARYVALMARANRRDAARAHLTEVLAEADSALLRHTRAWLDAGAPAPARPTATEGAAMALFLFSSVFDGQAEPEFHLPYLTLALALDPQLDSARLAYADALEALGRFDDALAALERVAPTSPMAETTRIRTAWTLRAAGRTEEAIAALRTAGDSSLVRLSLADMLRGEERWAEAEPLYDRLIAEGDPTGRRDWRLYFSRGAARERTGRFAEAEADLKEALRLSPDQPDVLNYLGYSWVDRGLNLDEGLELIARAVRLRPDSGYIVDSLGWAYFKLGDYPAALVHLERAVELSPGDPTLNDHLGDVYWRLGRRVEARFQWRRALSLEPTPAEQVAIEAKIAAGLPPRSEKRAPMADAKKPTAQP